MSFFMEVRNLEIKINREVKNYKESIFFGMSLRQFVCVVISCVFAVMIYFMFRNKLGIEITSWLCIVAALPFILVGFVKYNGMDLIIELSGVLYL